MSLYARLALVTAIFAALCAGAIFCFRAGANSEKARQAELKQAIQDTRDAAMKGAGDAIVQAKITNTVVQRVVETRTRTEPVYRDCKHAPGMRGTLDSALRGEPAGGGVVPEAASSPR